MNRRLFRLFVPILVLVAIPAMAVDGQIPIPFTSPIVTVEPMASAVVSTPPPAVPPLS